MERILQQGSLSNWMNTCPKAGHSNGEQNDFFHQACTNLK